MQLYFVLMAPARPENVGAAARAMKTMGFSHLRLVASEVHRREEAQWVAHGAQDILAEAECFADLETALADMDLVIATTARQRGQLHYYLTPSQVCEQIRSKSGLGKVAVLFGREDSGLSNTELARADLISYLPLRVSYPSLNLGQAIMLYAYELSSLQEEEATEVEAMPVPPAEAAVHALQQRAAQILSQIGVSKDEKLQHWVKERIPMLPQRDLNLLHLLCKDLVRALDK